MNPQYAVGGWARSPPFRPDSAQLPSTTMSALSKGSGSGVHRNSESGAAAVWSGSNDGFDAASYPADTVAGAQPTGSGALVDGAIGATGSRALATTAAPTTMAVATTHPTAPVRQTPFSGLFEDVAFPVHTLFTPPRPPGEVLPRVRRPNRAHAPVYNTDVARAGTREHNAQREVSRVWRGVLCRRRLRQARATERTLNEKARVVQCWWRCVLAKRRWRQLSELRSEWAKERTAQYVAARVQHTTSVLFWQHAKYEEATLRIQQAVRWFLREKARQRCAVAGLPESEWPPALPRPVARRRLPYFPWRNKQQQQQQPSSAKVAAGALVETQDSGANVAGVPSLQRTLLQFREAPQAVLPPTQAEVEAANAKMRVAEARQQAALRSPEAVSRREWKTEGLRQEDLDFNAGIVQRLYRSKRAPQTVHTKELTAAYFNKAARTIARTFRMYVLIKRMRARRTETERATTARIAQRTAARIADLTSEAVWQKDLMDAAARSIQRCWAWYRYRHDGVVPVSYRTTNTVPTPPPYGLIEAHIAREHALRWSTMNLLEQHKYEEQREHKYLHYVPKQIVVYEHTGFLFVQAPRKL